MTQTGRKTRNAAHRHSADVVRMKHAPFVLLLTALLLMLSVRVLHTQAQSSAEAPVICYRSEMVLSGDSLSSFAERYADPSVYDSHADYIADVCLINHLSDPDHLRAGSYLILPYVAD